MIAPLAVPLLFVVWMAFLARSGDPRADAVWMAGRPVDDPTAVAVVARYLRRVRTHRINGAVIGAGLALLRGLSVDRHVSIGIGGEGSPLGDLLFGGLIGLLVGSVMAETWRIKPRGTNRHADLAVRTVEPEAAAVVPVVAVLTGVTVVLAAVARTPPTLLIAAGSLVLLAVHRLVLRAIAERGRPALPADVRAADDAIRAYAGRRLGLEALATAVLLAGWQLATAEPPIPDVVGLLVVLGALVVTVVLVHRSRPWPPRHLRSAPTPATLH